MGRVSLALGVFAAAVLGLYVGQWLQKELQQSHPESSGTNGNARKKSALGFNGLAGKLAARLGLNAKDFAARQVQGWVDDGKEAVRKRFSGSSNKDDPSQGS